MTYGSGRALEEGDLPDLVEPGYIDAKVEDIEDVSGPEFGNHH